MSVIECFDCDEQFSTPGLLQDHLWECHISLHVDTGEDCPICGGSLSKENVTHHYPCFFEVDQSELGLFHDISKRICPLCDQTITQEEFKSHVLDHSVIDWSMDLSNNRSCSVCEEPIDGVVKHLDCVHAVNCRDNTMGESPYLCPEDGCDSCFSTRGLLLWHIWKSHFDVSNGQAVCPGCDSLLEIGELIRHIACVDEFDNSISSLLPTPTRTCFICDIEVYDSAVLHRHFHNKHLTRRDECPGCGEDLTEAEGADITDHIGCIARVTGETPIEWFDPEWPCPACGEIHSSRPSLGSHLEQEHLNLLFEETRCGECGEPMSELSCHLDCLLSGGQSDEYYSDTLHISPRHEIDEEVYFNDLYEFVDRERKAEREQNREEYETTSIENLARQQKAIPELVYVGEQYHPDFDTQLIYEYPVEEDDKVENSVNLVEEFGIYPYEIVLVGADQRDSHLPQPGTITFVDEQTIGIAFPELQGNPNGSPLQNLCKDNRTYHVAKLLNPLPYKNEREAIEGVQSGGVLRDAILGKRVLSGEPLRLPGEATGPLNEYQSRAVERALGTEDIVCIHGPPGTGKTRTLTHLIRLAVAQDMRVLAASHSNQAIDNLIVGTSTPTKPDQSSLHYVGRPAGRERFLPEELRDIDEDDKEAQQQATDYLNRPTEMSIARVGHNTSSFVVNQQYEDRPPLEADVVAGTMGSLGGADNNLGEFDLVVVDEAGQAAQPPTFIPASYSGTLVLVGDHLQLPPYVADEEAKEEQMHISLFEHLMDIYGQDISELLRRQYRMNEQIVAFPNKQIYGGAIETASPNAEWRVDDLVPIMAVDISGNEDTPPNSMSKRNHDEAEMVANHVKLLTNSGLEADEIGVITPYTAQIKTIDTAVRKKVGKLPELKISTVDSFQGSEREAIIVSWVRSNNRNNTGFLSFPEEGKRRLNVAMTRARRRLVLIGDWETLGTIGKYENSTDSCSKLFSALYHRLNDKNLVKHV